MEERYPNSKRLEPSIYLCARSSRPSHHRDVDAPDLRPSAGEGGTKLPGVSSQVPHPPPQPERLSVARIPACAFNSDRSISKCAYIYIARTALFTKRVGVFWSSTSNKRSLYRLQFLTCMHQHYARRASSARVNSIRMHANAHPSRVRREYQ